MELKSVVLHMYAVHTHVPNNFSQGTDSVYACTNAFMIISLHSEDKISWVCVVVMLMHSLAGDLNLFTCCATGKAQYLYHNENSITII